MVLHYKHHLIDPRIYGLRDDRGFSAEVYVFDCHTSTDTRFLLDPHVFATREEAVQAALQAGQKAIDEGYDPSVTLLTR